MIQGLNELLKKRFHITIHNQDLLDEAFTQASYVNEHPNQNLKFYERIEFLGDAVMQLVVSEYIYKRYPKLPQGRLTRLRAAMVNEDSFASFARECTFDKYIRLGKGEEKAHARNVTRCYVTFLNPLLVLCTLIKEWNPSLPFLIR